MGSASFIGLISRELVEEIPCDGSEMVAELSVLLLPVETSGLMGLVVDAGACIWSNLGFFLLEYIYRGRGVDGETSSVVMLTKSFQLEDGLRITD